MRCQTCGENEAVVHFTKIINGKMEESHLCESCAKKENDWGFNMPFSINDLFGGLVDFNTEEKTTTKTCPKCDMSYKKILSLGKLGCAECYKTFEDDISSLLRSIHGHDKHTGKIPFNSGKRIKKRRELYETKLELEHAILEERFEDAAEYRDKIKELEKEIEMIRKEEVEEETQAEIDERLEVAERDEDGDIDLSEFDKFDKKNEDEDIEKNDDEENDDENEGQKD